MESLNEKTKRRRFDQLVLAAGHLDVFLLPHFYTCCLEKAKQTVVKPIPTLPVGRPSSHNASLLNIMLLYKLAFVGTKSSHREDLGGPLIFA